MHEDTVDSGTVMYNGPPPTPPEAEFTPPTVPTIATLTTALVQSKDKLFFISRTIPNSLRREWHLIRVNMQASMSLRPTCFHDGHFLCEFYRLHSADKRCNGINQRYWLQYHAASDLVTSPTSVVTHEIRPSDTSEQFALRRHFHPFSQWITLTHTATYIHGPFDFATVNGQKTRDRISLSDLEVLIQHKDMYHNEPPNRDLPTYTVHVDHAVHVPIHCESAAALLLSAHPTTQS